MAKLFRVTDEHTWMSCTVPRHLLRYLKSQTTDRKLRLWACATTAHRHAQDVMAIVGLVEAWADVDYPPELKPHARSSICSESAWEAAYEGTVRTLEKLPSSDKKKQYTQFQLAAVHEVFGNPFRRVVVEPAWRTAEVTYLADGIYAEKAFDRMPILGDALEEAGCDNVEVLEHCRETSLVHLRGCWALDLILAKE